MSTVPHSDDEIHQASIDWLSGEVRPDDDVVDIGCGTGWMVRRLAATGATVIGVEPSESLVAAARANGLDVRLGSAEAVPLPAGCCSMIVCGVALPYMDPIRATREWSRLLRPGGRVVLTTHGLGYPMRHLRSHGRDLRAWVYAARMVLNTAVFAVLGRRLPGSVGDTLCHTTRMLSRLYQAAGLELVSAREWGAILGQPSFLAHRVRRSGD
ncbi:MAG: methyltransferase domain-containing protein [Gemmatimonadaceae bacterium]|jgi:SAM-dependent methyltransferase|nr:methyltransferase domain-containing protein [Gemmatimonadaceae bacterium]